MVDAPVTHLLTAQDYEDRGVRAMHAVLIELGQILGPYRGAVVVIGGAELLVASIPALLVMKGFALDGRDKPKDAPRRRLSTGARVARSVGIDPGDYQSGRTVIHIALDRRFVAWRKEDSSVPRLKDPRLYADDID